METLFKSDINSFSDINSRELIISLDDDLSLLFKFDSNGWLYSTYNSLEAACILLKSKYYNNDELRSISLPSDYIEDDFSDVIYYLTGGNNFWLQNILSYDNHEEYLKSILTDVIIRNCSNKNNLGELMDAFKYIQESDEFYEAMSLIVDDIEI